MKKRWSVIAICLLISLCIFGFSACNNNKPVKNAEFEEFEKVVQTVLDNSIGKLSNTAKTMNVASVSRFNSAVQPMAFTVDNKMDLFDVAEKYSDLSEPTDDEYIQLCYDVFTDNMMAVPLVVGDAIRTYHKENSFFGVPVGMEYSDVFGNATAMVVNKEGTHYIADIYVKNTTNKETVSSGFIHVDIDYKNENDFSYTACNFLSDFSTVDFYYGNSSLEFINVNSIFDGIVYRTNTTAGIIESADVTDECMEILDGDLRAIDQSAIAAIGSQVKYTVSKNQIEESYQKYKPEHSFGGQESGFEIENGILMGWRKGAGDEECPAVLTLPSNVNAIWQEFRIPNTVTKLVIPANIRSVKGEQGSNAYNEAFQQWLENGQQGPKPQPEDYPSNGAGAIVDLPAETFSILLDAMDDGSSKYLKEIEVVGNSPLFRVENHCLYSKNGTLLYIPESDKITSLTLDYTKASVNIEANIYEIFLPNLKNVDITLKVISQNGYTPRVDDLFEALVSTERKAKSYRFDSVTVRGFADTFGWIALGKDGQNLSNAVKSIKTLNLYGSDGKETDLEVVVSCAVDKINVAEKIENIHFNVQSGAKVKEISVAEDIGRIDAWAEENVRILLPWSQMDFEKLGKYSVLDLDEYTYSQLNWGYDTNEHPMKRRGDITIVFKEPSEQDKIDAEMLKNFKNYYTCKGVDSEYGYDYISIERYYGTGTVIRIPETMLGYPVAKFTLANGDVGSFGLPTVTGVTELYIPNTLKVFSIWNSDAYAEKYQLDKIVYDGTKEQFIALAGNINMVDEMLKTADRIVCSDGEFARQSAAETWNFADDNGNTLTVDVMWSEGSAAFNAIHAKLVFDGETFERHQIESSRSSFNFQCGGLPVDETGKDYKNQLSVEISGHTSGFGHNELQILLRDGDNNEVELRYVSSEEFIGVIEHDYNVSTVVEPNCWNDGYTEHRCGLCNLLGYEDNKVPALGHNYDEYGICTRCSDSIVTYTVVRNGSTGEYDVWASAENKDITSVKLLSEYNGYPVTVIETFRNCTKLEKIELSGSVTTIESSAFAGCTSLTSITIPTSVTKIGSRAFDGCTSLTDIWCEASSEPNNWSSGIELNWKYNCSATVHWGGTWEYVNGVPTSKS